MSLINKIPLKSLFFMKFMFVFFLSVLISKSVWAHDFSDWDKLLKQSIVAVTIDGVELKGVKYKELKSDPGFIKIIEGLKTASLKDLKTPEERLSFWINVYNILALKVVLDNYPVNSIKDAGSIFKSVWKREAGIVAGKMRTLDEVEHKILRKMNEPRIHFAIVCASVSCPDLRDEAYSPENLNEQLNDQVKKFLANPDKGMKIDEKKRRVYLSPILKWFDEDFEQLGGPVNFIKNFVGSEKKKFLHDSEYGIKYLEYNWKLNEV